MSVDRSELPPPDDGGSYWFSKPKNLLILAALVGGGFGLFVLLTKKASPAGSGQTTGTFSAGDLTMQSLANQVLQFRGEQSMYNADLSAALEESFGSVSAGQQAIGDAITQQGASISNAFAGQDSLIQNINDQAGMRHTAMTQLIGQVLGVTQGLDPLIRSTNDQAGLREQSLISWLSRAFGNVGAQTTADINAASQQQTSAIMGINDSLASGVASGDAALGAVSGQLSALGNMIRGLTALGEGSSMAYGTASLPRTATLWDNLFHAPARVASGSGYVGPTATNIAALGDIAEGNLSGSFDGGNGDLAQWLALMYQLPVRRVA